MTDRRDQMWAGSGLVRPQDVDREKLFRISPGDFRRPAAAARQSRKRARRIFIAVLGMDGFARPEREHPPRHTDLLALGAGEVHFDAAALAVVKRVMLEGPQVEIAVEFAIDPAQQ